MPKLTPLFESSTSTLYTSNDGKLRVEHVLAEDEAAFVFVVKRHGAVVLTTGQRIIADAYIAGYDLAMECETESIVPVPVAAPTDGVMVCLNRDQALVVLDRDDLIVAKAELGTLYDYEQNHADDATLHGLDTAITVLSKLIERLPEQ